MCVLLGPDAISQNTFPTISLKITSFVPPNDGSLSLKYVFGVDETSLQEKKQHAVQTRRHTIFKCAFGVDETLG